MRKETRLDHGLYYVDRSGDEYHKLNGDGCAEWSRANDEESRVLLALLREARLVLDQVAATRTNPELAGSWGTLMDTDITGYYFGLYYVSTDGKHLHDMFEGEGTLPNLWGAELIAAQTLVRYAHDQLSSKGGLTITTGGGIRPTWVNSTFGYMPASSWYNSVI